MTIAPNPEQRGRRAVAVVLDDLTALDVAEAISIRKQRLMQMAERDGVHIDPAKIERLSIAGRCYDQAIAGGEAA